MNFQFQRLARLLAAVGPPAPLKAFRPFPAMSQESIAIYSLFGPQATKANNTVTSSLPAEHGHKTALPLQGGLQRLRISAALPITWAPGGTQHFSTVTQEVMPLSLNHAECWSSNQKEIHPPKPPAPMMNFMGRKMKTKNPEYFFQEYNIYVLTQNFKESLEM